MDDLYHQTMTALEQSLHCRLIASELDLDRGVLVRDASDQQILALAQASSFSRVPLGTLDDQSDWTITHVALVDLERRMVQERRPITVEDVISGSTPIGMAFELLSVRPFYFILDPCRIQRILTQSDLNRLPVRTYLHTLLDHVEELLAGWCERLYPHDGWIDCLAQDAQERIQELHRTKQEADLDTRLVDCTTLSDKGNILGRSPAFLNQLQLTSRRTFRKEFSPVKGLRDRLDHGLPPLETAADELRNALRHVAPLSNRKDLARLNRVVGTLHAWIGALSGPDEAAADHDA